MRLRGTTFALSLSLASALSSPAQPPKEKLYLEPLNVNVPSIATDQAVKYDYDIVYVRTPRDPKRKMYFAEASFPTSMDAGGNLVLLKPDGREEVLVRGGDGSVADPFVSFDGQWVYYAYFHNLQGLRGTVPEVPAQGSDIYKIHVPTRKLVRLTNQEYTPNTGALAEGTKRPPILNLGPCPLPGGRVVFVSSRNGFMSPKSYTRTPTMQLFTMDDDGKNVEMIGHLNIGGALHPAVLKDGRIMFSSFESQGLRGVGQWGLWSIHPDGTNWGPLFSAFNPGSVDQITHFQTQLADGSIVLEEYYNQNNWGFGAYYKFPIDVPEGTPRFGSAYLQDPRNPPLRHGRFNDNGRAHMRRLAFSPYGIESLTPFTHPTDRPAPPSDRSDPKSPTVGKFTHPSGAPDNHLLTVYSPGPVNHNGSHPPVVDAGIYLIKDGKPFDEPAQMRLIKNDPNFNEQWPWALVPYKRIYGVAEPLRLASLANDGKRCPHLPEGTSFGLVGTSSLYKRESYPNGRVAEGSVTATYPGQGDRSGFESLGGFNPQDDYGAPLGHWSQQGAEAGKYSSSDIHAVRILAMEPTTNLGRRRFFSLANERLRILGEVPVRKFAQPLPPSPPPRSGEGGAGVPTSPSPLRGGGRGEGSSQPLDPDGNPDTSFLAKIPADTAFTFQTLDKDGMLLNAAQTWHQLRPGEIRNDCGGCHAHSQKPTLFEKTAASRPDYRVFDLTERTALLTEKKRDESGRKWDAGDKSGLRYEKGVKNVEYFRDVRPILDRSCVACHTKNAEKPAGNLVLDDEAYTASRLHGIPQVSVPGTYYRLVLDAEARFGHKPLIQSWRGQHSRYMRAFQSRRSLLIWKVHGRRTDGWTNDDFPTETTPGDPRTLQWHGEPLADTPANRWLADLDFTGSIMPPPEAVTSGKVKPLTDEDRRTLVRWIDLGCPIDFDFDPAKPQVAGYGWMCDDNRPTLTLTYPRAGANGEPLTRILVGMHDYGSGLNINSFSVTADFPMDGAAAGDNVASRFRTKSPGVWEMKLEKPIGELPAGKVTALVKDRQGNVTQVERSFSIGTR